MARPAGEAGVNGGVEDCWGGADETRSGGVSASAGEVVGGLSGCAVAAGVCVGAVLAHGEWNCVILRMR